LIPRAIYALTVLLLFSACMLRGQVAPMPDAPPSAQISRPGAPPTLSPKSAVSGALATPVHSPAVANSPMAAPLPSVVTLRISTNLVGVFLIARDSHHKLVENLKKPDCTVSEDHVRQPLVSFGVRADLPLTLGILLDTSLSQQNVLATEKQAGNAFLKSILKPKDEAFLMSFDVDVNLLAELTGDLGALEHAMAEAGINSTTGVFANGTIPSIGKPRGTALYDAVYLASRDTLHGQAGRKALILLTDGQDEGSRESLKSAIEAAQKADAIVYVLLISDPGPYGMLDFSGTGPIRKLAKETGGQVFEIGHDGRKMQAAFTQIENELRKEYEITYRPTNSKRDGTYRSIRVECRQNGNALHVRAREGYYALPASAAGGTSSR
jgi:VWFA-related protein